MHKTKKNIFPFQESFLDTALARDSTVTNSDLGPECPLGSFY